MSFGGIVQVQTIFENSVSLFDVPSYVLGLPIHLATFLSGFCVYYLLSCYRLGISFIPHSKATLVRLTV